MRGIGLPVAIADMTIEALSSLTQNRDAGDCATSSNIEGMTMMLASASFSRYALIRSLFRSRVNSRMLPKYFIRWWVGSFLKKKFYGAKSLGFIGDVNYTKLVMLCHKS